MLRETQACCSMVRCTACHLDREDQLSKVLLEERSNKCKFMYIKMIKTQQRTLPRYDTYEGRVLL